MILTTYDAAGRIQTWRYSTAAGASITYFDYTRDAKGLVTKVVREATHTIYYTYDANDRLTVEIWALTGGSPSEVYGFSYAYDLAGNRTRARRNGVDAYYFYDQANQLTVRGTNAAYASPTYYVYDLNGSLTDQIEPGGATRFAYNSTGMVARIGWQDSTATYFFYDGQLQRYAMVENGTPAYFLWDGLNVLEELTPGFTTKERHAHRASPIAGIGQVVESYRPAQSAPLQRLYPLMDPRGTITKWQQSDGSTVLAEREYDAFGQPIANSAVGSQPNRFGYQGQAWLEMLSGGAGQRLLLSPFRIYDPVDGRFLQNEPLLHRRQVSHYLYTPQNPLEVVDPLGLQGQTVVIGTISADNDSVDAEVLTKHPPENISRSPEDFYNILNRTVTECRKCGKPWATCCIGKLLIDGHGNAGVGGGSQKTGGKKPSDFKPTAFNDSGLKLHMRDINVAEARMHILRGLFCPGALIENTGRFGFTCGMPGGPDSWRVEFASLLTTSGGVYGGYHFMTWGSYGNLRTGIVNERAHRHIPKDADSSEVRRILESPGNCPMDSECRK